MSTVFHLADTVTARCQRVSSICIHFHTVVPDYMERPHFGRTKKSRGQRPPLVCFGTPWAVACSGSVPYLCMSLPTVPSLTEKLKLTGATGAIALPASGDHTVSSTKSSTIGRLADGCCSSTC